MDTMIYSSTYSATVRVTAERADTIDVSDETLTQAEENAFNSISSSQLELMEQLSALLNAGLGPQGITILPTLQVRRGSIDLDFVLTILHTGAGTAALDRLIRLLKPIVLQFALNAISGRSRSGIVKWGVRIIEERLAEAIKLYDPPKDGSFWKDRVIVTFASMALLASIWALTLSYLK